MRSFSRSKTHAKSALPTVRAWTIRCAAPSRQRHQNRHGTILLAYGTTAVNLKPARKQQLQEPSCARRPALRCAWPARAGRLEQSACWILGLAVLVPGQSERMTSSIVNTRGHGGGELEARAPVTRRRGIRRDCPFHGHGSQHRSLRAPLDEMRLVVGPSSAVAQQWRHYSSSLPQLIVGVHRCDSCGISGTAWQLHVTGCCALTLTPEKVHDPWHQRHRGVDLVLTAVQILPACLPACPGAPPSHP